MPDYQRSQKEHDALGGVYEALEETYGDSESREDTIRGIAESDVAHQYAQFTRDWNDAEYAEDERLAVEELRLTYPVEEHTYTFIRDPDATSRVPSGPWGRRGMRATEWLIYTSKRPDGTWYGSIQRFTEKQVAVDDFDTIMHGHPFEQEHAASERALLDDLIDHAHQWARRQNPRKKKKAKKKKASAVFRRLMRI